MATGLIALLDDIAALAKVVAASLDDAAVQATKAGSKAAGIVIDDAAVTPRYVVGFAADRELPVIWRIALGSLRNKFYWLLPGALLLSFFAPWLITPLLMAGGAYLCLEGYHKVMDLLRPHHHPEAIADILATPAENEAAKVSSAIRTDFILSAEIMAITLANVSELSIWMQTVVLAIVGVGMTALVYGAVALIVKADDMGAALARSPSGAGRAIGRAVVTGMPPFLKGLSFIGMLAMLWVGGGILIHGLHQLGVHGPEEAIKHFAKSLGDNLPALHEAIEWLVAAVISGVLGLAVGALTNPLATTLERLKPAKKTA